MLIFASAQVILFIFFVVVCKAQPSWFSYFSTFSFNVQIGTTNVFIRFLFFCVCFEISEFRYIFFFRYSNAEQSWIWNEHDTSGPINNWIPQGSFFYVSNSYRLVRSIYAFISKLLRCNFFVCFHWIPLNERHRLVFFHSLLRSLFLFNQLEAQVGPNKCCLYISNPNGVD